MLEKLFEAAQVDNERTIASVEAVEALGTPEVGRHQINIWRLSNGGRPIKVIGRRYIRTSGWYWVLVAVAQSGETYEVLPAEYAKEVIRSLGGKEVSHAAA